MQETYGEFIKNASGDLISPIETVISPFPDINDVVNSSGDLKSVPSEIEVYTPSKGLKYVTMHGEARNYGRQINSPILISVGGSNAHPDDTFQKAFTNVQIIKTGMVDQQGNPCDLFITRWFKGYILEGTPILGTVRTTGIPTRFTSGSK